MDDEYQRDRWHVGKEIPIALITVLTAQFFGGIWWFAQLSYKIDAALAQLQEFKMDRYTKEDGRKDRELILQVIDSLRQRDAEHDRRIEVLERRGQARS